MGYRDHDLMLADEQAVTTAAATASTNIYDQAVVGDIGEGEVLELNIRVAETVTSGGSATVTFGLQTDDNTSFSSATLLWTSSAIAKATLVAGYQLPPVRIPRGVERCLRGLITVATADLTAGKFDMWISRTVDRPKAYPSGYDV